MVTVGIAAVCGVQFGKARIQSCFKNKLLTDPTLVINLICCWLSQWPNLQVEGNHEVTKEGARVLQKVVLEAFNRSQRWAPATCRVAASKC